MSVWVKELGNINGKQHQELIEKVLKSAIGRIARSNQDAFAALRFVSFLSREKKEPLGGGEPRQARARENCS